MMIRSIVQSAFQTGYLSVESEALIRQILAIKTYQASELECLHQLYAALSAGQIRREACHSTYIPSISTLIRS
jgi:hypothetical protein